MSLIILLLLGSVTLGLAETLNGNFLKKFEKVSSVSLIIVGSVGSLIISVVAMFLMSEPVFVPSWITIALIILVGILFYFANKFFYNSFRLQDASTSTIICLSTIIVTTLFGRLVFNEQVALTQWLGVVLVVIAVILVNLGGFSVAKLRKVFSFTPANKLVLAAALLYGLANGFSKMIVQDVSPIFYQFLNIILVSPFLFIIDRKEVVEQIKVLKQTKVYMFLIITVPLYFAYNYIRFYVYSQGMALPILDAVDNTMIFVIILLEYLIFKIKPVNIVFKLVTALIAVIGVLLISNCY